MIRVVPLLSSWLLLITAASGALPAANDDPYEETQSLRMPFAGGWTPVTLPTGWAQLQCTSGSQLLLLSTTDAPQQPMTFVQCQDQRLHSVDGGLALSFSPPIDGSCLLAADTANARVFAACGSSSSITGFSCNGGTGMCQADKASISPIPFGAAVAALLAFPSSSQPNASTVFVSGPGGTFAFDVAADGSGTHAQIWAEPGSRADAAALLFQPHALPLAGAEVNIPADGHGWQAPNGKLIAMGNNTKLVIRDTGTRSRIAWIS
jgi:hypothetical protein